MKLELAILVVSCAVGSCPGQGTFTVTFDGPPRIAPGTGIFVEQYYEGGMWFRPLGIVGPGNGFVRTGSGIPGLPNNGTAYVQATFGDSLMFSFVDGSVFNLRSVEVAGYSEVVPNVTAYFTGYRSDGSTVRTSVLGSGLPFQTYTFGPEFSQLTRVEVPDFGSLDNFVIVTPEPGRGALLLLGTAVWAARRVRGGQVPV